MPHSSIAAEFLIHTRDLLDEYQARLKEIKSPLAADEATWKTCALQAERIIRDCADSLESGRPKVRGTLINLVAELGVERATQGISAVHSIRAGIILFDLVFDALTATVTAMPSEIGRFQSGVRALQKGIGNRLEAGALGHDTYLLNTVREVNAASRRQLAREIHDHLGNHVNLALRQLELHELQGDLRPEATKARIGSVKETLTDSLGIIRDLVTQLRRVDSEGTLQAALTAFLESMAIQEPEVRVEVNGSEEWATQDVLDQVFLVVRECLRNALAHAGAERVLAVVDIAPYSVQALIEDDGRGFDTSVVTTAGRANGIASATERVELLGGTILFASDTKTGGTRVTVTIPLLESSGEPAEPSF
ncbi:MULTISPECIES: sensor histidine kinase [unclassified Streptomyces]|uniref:sensor histidine kinase n=1 Tax=unclassified Streptomyces TaxID=2593676 RepID=UPI00278BE39C|nr:MULTISPECIES: histidine kinase [unclassified Streptomyces]